MSRNNVSIEGKVVIITGGAGGIGKAYATSLCKSGARVLLVDVASNVAQVASEVSAFAGSNCTGLQLDVSKEEDTRSMAEAAINEYGRIDVLVNNAAFFDGIVMKPFNEITVEEWDRLMAVNLRGPFLCCKAVFPHMRAQGRGKIINVSSETFFAGVPFYLHYVTSKGGIIAMTRALSRELGQYNITVNSIAPGYTLVPRTIERDSKAEHGNQVVAKRSLRRAQLPEDLTGTMLYLCSDASDFVTGQTIVVSGGDSLR